MTVSHLGHVELQVPDVAASVAFLTSLIGLQVTEVEGDRAYLRAWQDYDHHTLVLTEAHEPALGHVGWRVAARGDAERIERGLAARGLTSSWHEGAVGHGDVLRFLTPGGLPFEVYWEVERYQAPPELASRYPSHPSRLPRNASAPRRLDHFAATVGGIDDEVAFDVEVLGIKQRYYATIEGDLSFSWLSASNISHEQFLARSFTDVGPELHHLCYFLDSALDVVNLANVLVDHGVELQYGPAKHAPSGGTAIYFLEPGGHRLELSSTVMLCLAPDWEAQAWEGEEMLDAMADMWRNARNGMAPEYLAGVAVRPWAPPVSV